MSELNPTGRELDVLKALWELGPASVRQVHEHLCPDGELAFNTVQTMLRIMDDKGLVTHTAEGRSFIYTANFSRDQVTRQFLSDVFDGAVSDCVLTLLKTSRPKQSDLDEIGRMLDSARKPRR